MSLLMDQVFSWLFLDSLKVRRCFVQDGLDFEKNFVNDDEGKGP